MNQIERERVNRKLDTDEKIVIKALTEKISALKFDIKKLRKQMIKDECYDPSCTCMGNDYKIIEYNMSLGWSKEISEALLGEYYYGSN